MQERKCKICGKSFFTKSSRRSICYEDHYHPCPVCGKSVLTKDLYHLDKCCCKEHSRMKAIDTIRDKYEDWPCNTSEAIEKRKQTSLERYGVDNPSKNAKIKERVSEGLHRRYAIDGEDIRKRARQTYFEKTGYYYYLQNPENVEHMKKRNLEKYGYENTFNVPKFRAAATNIERFGTEIPMQNPEVWQRQRNHKSAYQAEDGTPLDSTYEVDVYNYCLHNNIPIRRTVPISFEYEGVQHKTFIDFEIDGMLVEVKGEHILDGYFDNQPDAVPMWRKLNVYKEHHVIVVTGQSASFHFRDSNGLKYLDKCPNPLIGVDIELFRNPRFPYRNDRPKCFYDVKVSGQQSSFEAFYDEKLRWDMIKNRINYVGGFISSKEILTALNVTRKCKQPSWFSVSYAEKLLKKYSISNTIVDPFSGWGTRCDASIKLHKQYIGCDLNEELVKWHQEQGRPITLGDAKEFNYDGDCDVFICPPYKDTEVYFEGQDSNLTQCEWLDIVKKNVPNARRYMMVCKVVDPGYEQYIVETKENKSHFGINKEYVLIMMNKSCCSNQS